MRLSRMLQREIVILMYHHVGVPAPSANIRGLYVTPRQFEWHLRLLQRQRGRFVTFATLCQALQSGQILDIDDTHPWIIITFDDGSLGVYEHAFPLLKRYQIPAVVYPVVGDIGKQNVVWDDSGDKTPQTIISAAQIQEMAPHGIEFGSHLYRHVHADRLQPNELEQELSESKQHLENILDRKVLSVAYPYGSYNAEVIQATECAGYRFGVTTIKGSNVGKHPLELCRTPVKGTRWYHPLSFWKCTLRLG